MTLKEALLIAVDGTHGAEPTIDDAGVAERALYALGFYSHDLHKTVNIEITRATREIARAK